jgi:hypothetical protein
MLSINDIAIVGDGNGIFTLTHHNRLSIGQAAGTSGGVTIMADGNITPELAQGILSENLGYQPHPGVKVKPSAISSSNTGAFLTAVLKGK